MASSLSEEEFQRLQLQILELRTENYTLGDACKRKDRELTALRQESEKSEKELQRLHKAVNKSKKAKEVDQLLQENDALQRKLFSQEEDFRLQNETIMKELGQVMEQNEKQEKELKELREKAESTTLSDSTETQEELTRLRAENNVLQKTLTTQQESHDTEVTSLRQTITKLESQTRKLAGRRETPIGQNLESRQVEGQSDQDSSLEDSFEKLDVARETSESPPGELIEADEIPSPGVVAPCSHCEELNKQLNEFKLKLDTELEMKKLQKEQLQSLETSSKEEEQAIQAELLKLQEKYKKKQESYVNLQEEKEIMFTKLSSQIEEERRKKDDEMKKSQVQAEDLKSELAMCNKTIDELQKSSEKKIDDLEKQRAEMQNEKQKMSEHGDKTQSRIKELESLVANLEKEVQGGEADKTQAYIDEIESLKKACRDYDQNATVLRQNVEDLATQLQASKSAHESCIEAQNALQEERDKQITALQEINRVAEKRKALLDELAIKYQTASEQHREAVKTLEEKHKEETSQLQQEISDLEKRLKQYSHTEEELNESRTQVSSLEETKGWLERRLKELEETLETTKKEHSEQTSESELSHADQLATITSETETKMADMKQEHETSKQELRLKVETAVKENEEKDNKIICLKQEIKDGQDAKKVHEKKGMTMVKDLKKQLQAERKRAEKLQERLQEYLQSDTRSRTSVEDLLRNESRERYQGDNSSVGSWSATASGISRDGASSGVTSPEEETADSTLGGVVEQEHQELLNKVAALQQEKWTLEEKVAHLESSNAAMCDDLINKTSIIEHHVMSSKRGDVPTSTPSTPSQPEKLSLRRVMDLVTNDREHEDMREMNRKLQTMLEETLTKNMHLQQNMEDMSLELVRLSKQGIPPTPVKQPNK